MEIVEADDDPVSYDVSTQETGGDKRLRRLSKACRDFGQRVQYSVLK